MSPPPKATKKQAKQKTQAQQKNARARKKKRATVPPRKSNKAPRAPRGPRGTRLPGSTSMVTDGVNVGSVWKNTTAERVTFPVQREKVSDLTSLGVAFQALEGLYVNPGNQELFPIFSQIARNYEEYVPNTLKFFFRTEEYMASGSNVSAGLVGMAVNFDPDAAGFGSLTELENYQHSISGPPFTGVMCCDILEERRRRGNSSGGVGDLALKNYFVNYSNNTGAPVNTPTKFYDVGTLQVLADGCQAGRIGELWVEYSFTMIRRLQAPGAQLGGVAHWSTLSAIPTAGANFTGMQLQNGSTVGDGITLSGTTISFPAGLRGDYFLAYQMFDTTALSVNSFNSSTGGVTLLDYFVTNSGRNLAPTRTSQVTDGLDPASVITLLTFNLSGVAGTIVFEPVTMTGIAYADIFMFAIPFGLTVKPPAREDHLAARLAKLEKLLLQDNGSSSQPAVSRAALENKLPPVFPSGEELECLVRAAAIADPELARRWLPVSAATTTSRPPSLQLGHSAAAAAPPPPSPSARSDGWFRR